MSLKRPLKCKENPHRQINICSLTHTTHWSTGWGLLEPKNHQTESEPTRTEGKEKEQKHTLTGHLSKPLKTSLQTGRDGKLEHYWHSLCWVYETLRRIFNKPHIPAHFKPTNTLRQKLVHCKDKPPWHRQIIVVYANQCSQDCTDLYIEETKQSLYKLMAQHRSASSSGQDSAVHLHLREKGHSFEDSNTFWV